MRHITIIGSGPAGCYLADQLHRLVPDAAIDILERLPVPFGLVRYGVAPDHQSTKAVARVFDRVLSRDRISFFGNVEVGRDLQLEELMSLYDAVVLATGAWCDRRLNIPGEELPGVMGSAAFTAWYNGHPDYPPPVVRDVRSAVIIGNGNVAIDVARVLAKSATELTGSDLPPQVKSWLEAQPIEAIHIVGRRSAADAKFTQHELAELATLKQAHPVVNDAATLGGETPVVDTLRIFAANESRNSPVTIYFHFSLTPITFLGDDQLKEVQFGSPRGELSEICAQLAVTCIGYEARACSTASPTNGIFASNEGKIKDRLYVVGWAKRGPSGTIPTNRTEAQQVAQKIAQEVVDGARLGRSGLMERLEAGRIRWVDYAAWKRIEAAELAGGNESRCRRKLLAIAEMLDVAHPKRLISA